LTLLPDATGTEPLDDEAEATGSVRERLLTADRFAGELGESFELLICFTPFITSETPIDLTDFRYKALLNLRVNDEIIDLSATLVSEFLRL
jgi:hypothetical protein